MRATARPWLPSVAVTSVTGPASSPLAARSARMRWTAQDAPSALKAGSPSRHDSSLTKTRLTPNSPANKGSSVNGVGA